MNSQLSFENLYKQALIDWPETLDLSELQYATPDFSRYTVKGLGVLSDDIEHRSIGTELEVIFRVLHTSIYSTVHSIAKFTTEIKVSSIRPRTIQLIVDERLKTSLSRSDLNWKKEDYKLVELYFSQNKS